MELGTKDQETALAAVTAIGDIVRDVFARADREEMTPPAAATALAEDRVAAARRTR
jgi:hypothetical protein